MDSLGIMYASWEKHSYDICMHLKWFQFFASRKIIKFAKWKIIKDILMKIYSLKQFVQCAVNTSVRKNHES